MSAQSTGYKRAWEKLAQTKTPEQVVFGSWLAPRYSREVDAKDLRIVEEMLEVNRNDLILDVGCGPLARTLTSFGERGFRMIGLDISTAAVTKAKEVVHRREICGNVDFVVGDAEFLPFRAGVFDRALAVSVFAHLSSRTSVLKALGEVFRCLKSGGLCYLSWWLNLYSPLSLLLVFGNRLGFVGKSERVQILTFKGSKEVCGLCKQSGLVVAKVITGSVFWYLSYLLPKMFRSWNRKLLMTLGNFQNQSKSVALPPFAYDVVAHKTPVPNACAFS